MLSVVAIATTAYARQFPEENGYVNDLAQLLTREQGESLNDELVAFEKKTGFEVVVSTVPVLGVRSIGYYAQDIAEDWGIDERGKNNGVVFLIAPRERQTIIKAASGAHLVLERRYASQIQQIQEDIISRFEAGNIAEGIVNGTHEIMRVIGDANSARATAERREKEELPLAAVVLLYIMGIMFLIFLFIIFCGIFLPLLFLLVPPLRRSEKACKFFEFLVP